MAKSSKKSAPKKAKSAPKAKSKPKPVKAKAASPKKLVAKAKPAKKSAPVKKVAKPVAKKIEKKPVKLVKPAKAVVAKLEPKARGRKKKVDEPEVIVGKPTNAAPNVNMQLTIFPSAPVRPIAHKPAKTSAVNLDKTRYSEEELAMFEALIKKNLSKAKEEFKILKDTLNRTNDEGTDSTSGGNTKVLEDGAETAEKENLSQLAARQLKYITSLENALVRIKNGTYGICSVTGKLISKERLMAVPHTTQSIEAKMMKKD
jgi:RNA polymerase-binding transcription factor DksA